MKKLLILILLTLSLHARVYEVQVFDNNLTLSSGSKFYYIKAHNISRMYSKSGTYYISCYTEWQGDYFEVNEKTFYKVLKIYRAQK